MVLILSTFVLTLVSYAISCNLISPSLVKPPSQKAKQVKNMPRPAYPHHYYDESVPCEISPALRLYLGSRTYDEFLKSPVWVYKTTTTAKPTTTKTTFEPAATTISPHARTKPTIMPSFLMSIGQLFRPLYIILTKALETGPEMSLPKRQLLKRYTPLPYCPYSYYLFNSKNASLSMLILHTNITRYYDITANNTTYYN
jgi:hypothetical protein